MKRIFTFLLFITIAFSCEKEYHTTIPYAQVNLRLELGTTDFDLTANLAYKTFTQRRNEPDRLGFGGILVINGMGESTINLFAFDLACPVEAQHNVHVIPDKIGSSSTAVTATCPKCGAVFNIASGTGSPQSGTKYHLRSYRVVGNGMQYTVVN
jgi:hypothetical protein